MSLLWLLLPGGCPGGISSSPSSDKAAIPELELLECQQGPHTGNISMRKRSNGTQQLQPPWAGLHCHPEPGKGDRERRHFLGHLHS